MDVSKPTLDQIETIQASQRSGDIARFAKGAGISTSGKMVGRGLNFVGQVLLARLLGPDAFGLYAIGWTILRIISIIGPLGLDSGVIRFGSKYWRDDQENFRKVFYISTGIGLISGLFIGVGLYLGAPFLAIHFFHKPELESVLRGFAIAAPMVTALRVVASATTVSQQLKYATYSEEVSQPASQLLFVIALLILFGLRVQGAVFTVILSFCVALALATYYMLHLFPGLLSRSIGRTPGPAPAFYLEIIQFSIPTAFAALFGSSISWVDRLMVGLFRSEAETGIYTTISLVSIIFAIILSGIKVIFSPMIADLYHIDNKKRVEEIYRISTKWGLYIGIPLFLVILFGSRELLALSFGAEYVSGSLPLIFLSLAQLVNIGTGPLDVLLIMTGRQKSWMAISGIMVAANIVINSILIPPFGLIGAAIGTASTVSGIFIIGVIKVKRDLAIWPYDRRSYKILISTALTSAVLFGVSYIHLSSPIMRVSLVTLIAVVVFGVGILILGLDSEDIELFNLLRKRIPKNVSGKINL